MKHDRLAWPILLLLLTVLIPSVGVVWMMREAVRNERVATNQRLLEAYRLQLDQAADTLADRWDTQQSKLSGLITEGQPAFSFVKIVTNFSVDSVVLCDTWGEVVYPETDSAAERIESNNDPRWQAASHLEFVKGRYVEAAEAYGEITKDYLPIPRPDTFRGTDSLAAILAKARCLDKTGDRNGAIDVLQSVSHYWVEGAHAEAQKCAAYLRLLELSKKGSPVWKDASKRLEVHLLDYEKCPMGSYQRHFLMKEFQRLTGESGKFPTQAAESLAIEYVGQLKDGQIKLPGGLRLTKIAGVWQDYEKESKLVSLYRAETIQKNLLSLCNEIPLSEGMAFSVTAPSEKSNNLMDVSLGPKVGDWQLGLRVTDGNPFSDSSKQQNAVYVWIAALTVAATCVLAWLLLTALRRRMRLAQLKNDLVATVSHELKTPLASIRLLVDTLQANEGDSEASSARSREYLQLISKENARLTRLIDNFLTFSSLERGSQALQRRDIKLTQLINQARAVFLNHVPEAEPVLHCDAAADVQLTCDVDGLVTVIVNLLENAWKYSAKDKQIKLLAGAGNSSITISVSDNGIGLSPVDRARVFDRFYQVDQRVARDSSGCGLGLSIVQSIVRSHGGSVAVESKLGEGSTFTIELPRIAGETKTEPMAGQ